MRHNTCSLNTGLVAALNRLPLLSRGFRSDDEGSFYIVIFFSNKEQSASSVGLYFFFFCQEDTYYRVYET